MDQPVGTGVLAGLTPLMIASGSGHLPVVAFLLGQHADVNRVDANGRSALHYVSLWDDHPEVAHQLLHPRLLEPEVVGADDGRVDQVQPQRVGAVPAVVAGCGVCEVVRVWGVTQSRRGAAHELTMCSGGG